MVLDRIQKERRTQFRTSSVEPGEFVDEDGHVDETEFIDVPSSNDSQHRPSRSRTDPLATPAPDAEDQGAQADQQASQSEEAVVEQTAPEDQFMPKKGHQMGGTPGDTFETPNIGKAQPDTGGTSDGAFQTPTVPEEPSQSSGNAQPAKSNGAFQTVTVPQGELQSGTTSGDTFETPNIPQEQMITVDTSGNTIETPGVPQERPQIRGNGGSFQTADGSGSLIISPPYKPPDSGSSSPSWLDSPMDYFAFGAFVTISVMAAFLVMCGCNSGRSFCRRRRRFRKLGERWANEIKFHDEYDVTDEDSDPEDFHAAQYLADSHPHDPINAFGGSKSGDPFGDMNFAVGEEEGDKDSQEIQKVNDFDFHEDDKSEASSYDSDGNSLSDLLNGEATKSNRGDSLSEPDSPPSSPLVNFDPEPTFSPPTVSEVFKNSMSPHWKNGKKPAPVFDESSSFDELQRRQGDLNQALFKINDQLLEQQRELKAAANNMSQKATRRKHRETSVLHKKITDEISRLESEKEDIDAKIKAVKTQLKTHRYNRRLKLFESHDG